MTAVLVRDGVERKVPTVVGESVQARESRQ